MERQHNHLEKALMQGLDDALAFEKGKKKLRTQERVLPDLAPSFTSQQIKKLRKRFQVTQEEFARIMNVQLATIRSWEQGIRKPANASNRLLQIFTQYPDMVKALAD